jgi:nucleoside-diphosphate-sugar epimerase
VGPYGEAKIAAEEECLRRPRAQGLCVPIIRPKSFIGPERLGVFALLYDWAYTGHGFPMIGNGNNRYQLLDVEDLCEAIWLLTLEATVNDTFNIGAEGVHDDARGLPGRARRGQATARRSAASPPRR